MKNIVFMMCLLLVGFDRNAGLNGEKCDLPKTTAKTPTFTEALNFA